MIRTKVTARVRDLILGFTYYEPGELTDDTQLDLDSLDIAELMQGLENEFDIEVEDRLRLEDIESVRTIVSFVDRTDRSP